MRHTLRQAKEIAINMYVCGFTVDKSAICENLYFHFYFLLRGNV